MIETFRKVDTEGTYFNIMQAIYNKPTVSIVLNGEKLKAFPLRSGTRPGCQLLPLLVNSFGSPSYSNQTGKRSKGNPIGEEEVKWSLFADDMILYIEDPKDLPENY